jgi:hypothetical protein
MQKVLLRSPGDVGVDPGDAVGGVDLDHGHAGLGALCVGRDLQASTDLTIVPKSRLAVGAGVAERG